jgi:hypothetical protein
MSLVITVTRAEPCHDPLLPFQTPEDKQALRLFKKGAVLLARRESALYGCWLEHEGTSYPFLPNSATSRALQELGEQSGERTMVAPDVAAGPEVTFDLWEFAAEKLAARTKRWHRAKRCADDWKKHSGHASPNITGLSEKALATLRYMQRQYAMCMHAELFDVWLELNTRGLVDINANGGVHLRPAAQKLRLPWGAILKLKPVCSEDAAALSDKPVGALPPLLFPVANPVSVPDPLLRFAQGAGKQVLDLFKEGAVLHVHRGATPNNWWLAHKDGREHQFNRDVGTARALETFATHTSSNGTVSSASAFLHNDGGKPMEETWEFCPSKLAILRLEWGRAQECAEDWNTTAGIFNGDTSDLPELALAALRTLQQKYTLPMYPELFEAWLALNAKGYLEVFAEGYAQLVPAARALFVVHGPRLEVQHPKVPYGTHTK